MWLLLTIFVFFISRQLSQLYRHPLNNVLLMSLLCLMPLLYFSGDNYDVYFSQTQPLHFLLDFAVIALAVPLYEQYHLIRHQWRTIFTACFLASLFSAFSGAAFAYYFSEDWQLVASVLPKSISTPFAINVSEQLGGITSISATLVTIAGLFGGILGYPILNWLKIQSPLARGLSIGAVSHAIGTARASEEKAQEGAFSSLALVLCGVFTALLAPFIFQCLQWAILFIQSA